MVANEVRLMISKVQFICLTASSDPSLPRLPAIEVKNISKFFEDPSKVSKGTEGGTVKTSDSMVGIMLPGEW